MKVVPLLLLAAGQSARMGEPKQLLNWGENNLIQKAMIEGSKFNLPLYTVLGAHFDKINKSINSKKYKIIHNKNWEKGIGNSISTGIKKILNDYPILEGVLIYLVDQPLIEFSHLFRIYNSFNNKKRLVVSSYKDNKLGVPALFGVEYLKFLIDLDSDNGAASIIKKIYSKEKTVIVNNESYLIDLDDKKAYENFYKEFVN